MNKKVLSAILFSALFAGTGTFTSCIDNDEPAGIEELRGAKAALLLAKVEVEKADAAFTLAQAEVEKAKAAIKNAKAEYEAALAEGQRLANELQAAQNEQEKLAIEAAIADAKRAAELAAITHEEELLSAKTALAEAKRTYELTLAKIEVAKELLPYQDMVEISYFQGLVSDAQDKVDDAVAELEDAKEDYDDAAIDYKYKGEIEKKRLENAVAKQEGLLAAAKEELAKWEGFLENDVETADWRAEIDSLNELLVALDKEKTADLELELARLENSDEYKALKDAVEEAGKPAVLDSVYSYTYYGAEDSVALKTSENGAPKTELFNGEEIEKTYVTQEAIDLIEKLNADGELIDGLIKEAKDMVSSFTAEKKNLLDTIAKYAENDTTALGNSNKAIKAWEDALKAYNGTVSAADLAVAKTAAETAANTFVTAYNAAAGDAAKEKTAAEAYRKVLIKYYDAAKKNGMTFNNIALGEPALYPGTSTVYTKYTASNVYTLLNDATNGAANLVTVYEAVSNNVNYFLTVQKDKTKDEAYKSTPEKTEADVKVATWLSGAIAKDAANDYLAKLEAASEDAFGPAAQYITGEFSTELLGETGNYLQVKPDTADVLWLAGQGSSNLGYFGTYLLTEDDAFTAYAKNYKEIIKNYEGAEAYWTAKVAILKAALVAQEAALEAAEIAQEEYEIENIEAIGDKIDVINERAGRIEAVRDALKAAVEVYLPAELKGSSDYATGAETFAKMLAGKIESAQDDVEDAEDDLAGAQIDLEKNENGTYSSLESAKVAYEKAQAKLDEAQAELDKALKDLEKALEIFAATSAE